MKEEKGPRPSSVIRAYRSGATSYEPQGLDVKEARRPWGMEISVKASRLAQGVV